jgi:hypothetical protein
MKIKRVYYSEIQEKGFPSLRTRVYYSTFLPKEFNILRIRVDYSAFFIERVYYSTKKDILFYRFMKRRIQIFMGKNLDQLYTPLPPANPKWKAR